mmetsp:Transcript_27932/g.68708  ORF Transcript_27932/g.68708 Transcript_27932/m.68708 type:complete len:109 (+) Transcript_27932:1072-1398(+)
MKSAAVAHVDGQHQYYAAVVQTSHSVGASATFDDYDAQGVGGAGGVVVNGVGYEEFLIHRPNGDAWIAGSLPPVTSVRRASFGPKLRGELKKLAVEQQQQQQSSGECL